MSKQRKSHLTEFEQLMEQERVVRDNARQQYQVDLGVAKPKARPSADVEPTVRHTGALLQGLRDHLHAVPLVSGTEILEYKQIGVQLGVLLKLRKGFYGVADSLDLHYDNGINAKTKLVNFILSSLKQRYQCVIIIHGKCLHSATAPKLKNLVNNWLRQIPAVLAFTSAPAKLGGSGAVMVLLSKSS